MLPGQEEQTAGHRAAAGAHVDVSGQLKLEGSVDAVLLAAVRHQLVVVPAERPGPPFAVAAAAEGWRSGDPSLSVVVGQWSAEGSRLAVFAGVLPGE